MVCLKVSFWLRLYVHLPNVELFLLSGSKQALISLPYKKDLALLVNGLQELG